MEINSKERQAKIKAHIDYYNQIREVGVIEACKQGIIKSIGVSFSGGKDSVATLLWAKNNIPKNTKIIGAYVKTPLENVDIENYVKYVSDEIGIKIDIWEHTEESAKKQIELLIEATKVNGPPFTIRNCEVFIKEPIYKKFNFETDIQFIGVRWRESQLRQNATKLFRFHYGIFYHPIISWSKQDVFNYIKDNKIKLYPTYQYADRLGCSICPLGLGKKKCNQIHFIAKFKNQVDWNFYDKWYEAMCSFKFDRSGEAFVTRLNYLKDNWRKLKKLINSQDAENIKIKKYNPPAFGWFDAK